MNIKFDIAALGRTKWHEYAIRFLFGGSITVVAGLLANRFGPVIGGLFLAFPAIFPASATLIEKHETEKKRKAGIYNTFRGCQLAAVDAQGAALGSIGLACFAFFVWKMLPRWNAGLVLLAALILWFVVSLLLWLVVKAHRLRSGA